MKIIGIEKINYINKEKKEINGTKLYLTDTKYGVLGLACEEVYLPGSIDTSKCEVGDDVTIYYNRFGNIVSFNIDQHNSAF